MRGARVALWEIVAGIILGVLGVLLLIFGTIYYVISTLEKLYAHRNGILKLSRAVWRARYPVFIASLIGIALYLRPQVDQTTLVNFPPFSRSPFPHLSLYAAPLLDNLTYTWVGALALSIIYTSRNRLVRFPWIGNLSRRTMIVFLLTYPAMVLWFSISAEISFLIPSWAQTPLWLLAAFPLSMIVFRSTETIIGRKIWGKQGLVSLAVDKSLAVAAVGMQSIGAGVYGGVSSRFGASHPNDIPKSSIRATVLALFVFLSLASMGVAYELGYTSILQLFYAFGAAPYALAIASGLVGWRITKREAEESAVSRLTKTLDMFQRGAYPQTISIHSVVHIANTRWGDEIDKPFEPWSFDKTLATLLLLQKLGYHIQIDTEKERVAFTLYPL